jgi:hypothetical protein
MKTACWMVLFLICALVACAAEPPPEARAEELIVEIAEDFGRNAALGAALSMRRGTTEEVSALRELAERGLRKAREAVERDPDSVQAQYWLGSWLLYGYDVVEVEQVTYDPEGGGRTETVALAVQGLSEAPEEGLDALRRSTELAPNSGDHLLEYATALADYGRVYEARALLKAAWVGEPELALEQKMHAGLLLADIAAIEENLAAAREWVYAALSLSPAGAMGVERLRYLDAAQAAEALAAAAAAEAAEEFQGAQEFVPDIEEWVEFEAEPEPQEDSVLGENQ